MVFYVRCSGKIFRGSRVRFIGNGASNGTGEWVFRMERVYPPSRRGHAREIRGAVLRDLLLRGDCVILGKREAEEVLLPSLREKHEKALWGVRDEAFEPSGLSGRVG